MALTISTGMVTAIVYAKSHPTTIAVDLLHIDQPERHLGEIGKGTYSMYNAACLMKPPERGTKADSSALIYAIHAVTTPMRI